MRRVVADVIVIDGDVDDLMDGLLNINYETYMGVPVAVPDETEQKAIADQYYDGEMPWAILPEEEYPSGEPLRF